MIIVPAIIHIMKSCARALVAEDPYQYEELSVDQLISTAIRHKIEGIKSVAVDYEIKKRLADPSLDDESRILLSTLLEQIK